MAQVKPALTTTTKLANEEITDVKVKRRITVTYIVNIKSATRLNLPYAVAVNGVVQEPFMKKTKRVIGDNGKIIVNNLEAGAKVELFLNSDAHPRYRKNPVYGVSPTSHDLIVKISEKPGKCSETDTPVFSGQEPATSGAALAAKVYNAALTGDIWMRISHKYSSSEVEQLLPENTSAVVGDCVRKIYEGLSQASMEIVTSPVSPGQQPRKVHVLFEDGANPRENILSGYDLLAEGLKRVHPAGYAALFTAAIDSGIEKIVLTSAWRPMLGSIAHRAGLGLDVNFVGTTRLNRAALCNKKLPTSDNVSQRERDLFERLQAAKMQQEIAKKKISESDHEVSMASRDPSKILDVKQKSREADEAKVSADNLVKSAAAAWDAERDKNEPSEIRRFRAALMKCQAVVQIFDPWFMDQDTRDNVPAIPNMQVSPNERLHSHHLHITVRDPQIL